MSSETENDAIAMSVGGIVVDPNSQVPVVILRGVADPRLYLPIYIGGLEATAIATVLADVDLPRPMTHDLIVRLLVAADTRVERVLVTRLSEGTFFAEIVVVDAQGVSHHVDARPSDSVALALRVDAPIFVAKEVILEAGAMSEDRPDEGDEAEGEAAAMPDGDDAEASPIGAEGEAGVTGEDDGPGAPSVVSGRKVRLEDLDPEDFGQYEM